MTWAALGLVVVVGFAVAGMMRRRRDQPEPEEQRRRRALDAIAKPMKGDWLLRNGYAKDGRDHR